MHVLYIYKGFVQAVTFVCLALSHLNLSIFHVFLISNLLTSTPEAVWISSVSEHCDGSVKHLNTTTATL